MECPPVNCFATVDRPIKKGEDSRTMKQDNVIAIKIPETFGNRGQLSPISVPISSREPARSSACLRRGARVEHP